MGVEDITCISRY